MAGDGEQMDVGRFLAAEDAVSPVIGVILMVAITVTLATVIGTMFLGLGETSNERVPTTNFEERYDESAGELTVTHSHGNTLDRSQLSWVVTGGDGADNIQSFTGSGKVSPGDKAILEGIESTETVRLVWKTPESDDSAPLMTWTGPDA